jgi:hypothetical protein
MAKRRLSKKFRLSFGGTRRKIWTGTRKAAIAEARYWLAFGQKKVCIDRKLPTGTMKRVKCMKRAKRFKGEV